MKTIEPFDGPIDATVRVPGSKSATNRALLLAALADGVTQLRDAVWCDDSRHMVDCLRRLGFAVDVRAADTCANRHIAVTGTGGTIRAPGAALDAGNAGTVARFITAAVTLGNGRFVVDGNSRMRERPIGDLRDALTSLGANVESTNGCPPVTVVADGLPGGHAVVSGTASSQFLSALLLVAPCARSAVRLDVGGTFGSKPYVALTLAMMRDFGVPVEHDGVATFFVRPARYRAKAAYPIEPDASSASYPLGAVAAMGGRVRVEGLGANCRQGDIGFVQILREMGCRVSVGGSATEVECRSPLSGVAVDLADMPDVAPTLAAIAPFASSPTTIRGIASARRKESDRIAALCTELTNLGVRVLEHEDGLTIEPCDSWRPGVVHTYADHRIAMALSLVGLRIPGVEIEDPGCVTKTFPGFFEMLEELRP
ncbi:MAG: 3-phosphoshikimate 1-carboxyvinyltransferase [Bacteroidales bacterium]